MTITIDSGKAFDIRLICTGMRSENTVLVELEDDRALSEIAADFEGAQTITKTDSKNPNVKEVYEGFTQLVRIYRPSAGIVRLTLGRSAANG